MPQEPLDAERDLDEPRALLGDSCHLRERDGPVGELDQPGLGATVHVCRDDVLAGLAPRRHLLLCAPTGSISLRAEKLNFSEYREIRFFGPQRETLPYIF